MAGVSYSIDADFGPVRDYLRRLEEAAVDLREPMEEIGSAMVSSTTQRFKDSKAPDGTPWATLAESTMLARMGSRIRKKRGGTKLRAIRRLASMKILVDRGHLRQSLTHRVGSRSVEWGSKLIYAAIHQLGGKAGRGRRVTIPARPYLGLSRGDKREIGGALRDYLAEVGA